MHFGNYQIPMTPPEFGSDHGSPYCSPRPLPHVEPVFSHVQMPQQMSQTPAPTERQHTTSGVSSSEYPPMHTLANDEQRRRAQNRAAQRAFRERKEKHARDLEAQLAVLTDKHNKLETSYSELSAAYEKLRKTFELFTQEDDAEGGEEEDKQPRRSSSNSETMRKILDILHGEFKGTQVKSESP